ncbi:MAG: hypothetical protein GIW99_01990 [Candidatus Eremiobacteraeota bacterium]|nr:hypothetical protein [Candidatus Eremiobacteraeota bacterium]MBC5826447.1 hypothetical protein [Candidatus Eremiobacteraeota bacterium]
MSVVLSRASFLRNVVVAVALLLVMGLGAVRPALAETAGQRSTRNIVLGGLAVVTGIILYNNYEHKKVAHDTIVGRTRDGGVVYADGRVVYPNGQVVYTSNNGRTPCTYDGYGQQCGPYVRGYRTVADEDGYARYGHDYGHRKHRHHRHDRDDRGDDGGDRG